MDSKPNKKTKLAPGSSISDPVTADKKKKHALEVKRRDKAKAKSQKALVKEANERKAEIVKLPEQKDKLYESIKIIDDFFAKETEPSLKMITRIRDSETALEQVRFNAARYILDVQMTQWRIRQELERNKDNKSAQIRLLEVLSEFSITPPPKDIELRYPEVIDGEISSDNDSREQDDNDNDGTILEDRYKSE